MTVFEKVYAAVQKIPPGKVATYGQIAEIVGTTPRVVGFALHANPDEGKTPCHRVVNRFGGLAEVFAFGGRNEQKMRLLSEGVTTDSEGNVPLATFRVFKLDIKPGKALF